MKRDWNSEKRTLADSMSRISERRDKTPPMGSSNQLQSIRRRDEIRRKAEARAKALRASQEQEPK